MALEPAELAFVPVKGELVLDMVSPEVVSCPISSLPCLLPLPLTLAG
jgi:hypothetical protein